MTNQQLFHWLFPFWQLIPFGFTLTAGALWVSHRLNHQSLKGKLRNALIIGLALYGSSLWIIILSLLHHEDNPLRWVALMTVVYLYILLGDWIAFCLKRFDDWADHRAIQKAIDRNLGIQEKRFPTQHILTVLVLVSILFIR